MDQTPKNIAGVGNSIADRVGVRGGWIEHRDLGAAGVSRDMVRKWRIRFLAGRLERWFAELITRKLRRPAHRSVTELRADTQAWINAWNADPKPFTWTKTADEILETLAAHCQRINDSRHWIAMITPENILTIFDSSVYSVKVKLSTETDDGYRLGAAALSAIYGFMSGFCRPLSLDVSSVYWDNDLDLPVNDPLPDSPSRMFLPETLPDGIDIGPFWVGQVVSRVEDLNYEQALKIVTDLLDEASVLHREFSPSWEEIWIRASSVRMPESNLAVAENYIMAEHRAELIKYPIEVSDGSEWVAGPLDFTINSPIEIYAFRDFGFLFLNISTSWSVWTPEGPGFADFERGITRLRRAGWE